MVESILVFRLFARRPEEALHGFRGELREVPERALAHVGHEVPRFLLPVRHACSCQTADYSGASKEGKSFLMPSKSKAAHVFKVGDPAIVCDARRHLIVNAGTIVQVTAVRVVFEGPTNDSGTRRWIYKRKGTRWVEMKKDHFELEPTP
jgi:hypothetical protein